MRTTVYHVLYLTFILSNVFGGSTLMMTWTHTCKALKRLGEGNPTMVTTMMVTTAMIAVAATTKMKL
jgi:hypothetical protein